ncbi:uroporphyrinogen-III synthase [Verminephrobacter aporrectodeae subsp. tuberculatae]|uniref:uroporphyrinogen-III synthase n=1 Tax=Verminephrobacter aporrectodeae TaxID=1110389 RepID=UPI0022374351|nr:uroporphyrinogen-III synthase [Verminephrobacter aporrectodeae]MCW5257003.1 uroporphyrinogen-III synthase [Verminephrobacter aporrectodeae subsp. tuberculatae]
MPPRVIVTRPADAAAHWVRQLGARGITAAALPLIGIGPCTDPAAQQALSQARARLAQHHYRALMFVSGHAVAHFFASNAPNAPNGPSMAPDVHSLVAAKTRAFAPGPGTLHALVLAGVPRACIDGPAPDAAQFDSEALWQQVAPQIRPGDRVLIVRGRSRGAEDAVQGTGRDWFACQIEAAGGQVECVVAYERSAPRLGAAQRALAQQAAQDGSLWLLSSSEAVAHLAAALPAQRWAAAQALSTHPRIAQAARALGFGRVHECRPALADVLASIESAA